MILESVLSGRRLLQGCAAVVQGVEVLQRSMLLVDQDCRQRTLLLGVLEVLS